MNVLHSPARRRKFFVAAAFIYAALTGCAQRTVLPASHPAASSLARVAFTIAWPSGSVRPMRISARPTFVSPSTMSAIVTINGDPSLEASANNPGTGTSTVSLSAPVGEDDFVISLYDAPQPAGASSPAGNLLGRVEVVQTVEAAKLNTVAAVVNGLVHSVTAAPTPNQPVLEGSGASFTLVGQHQATFVLTPRDADGNAIIAPGITPALTLRPDAANSYFSVVPDPNDATRFTVIVTARAPAGSAPTFTAQATDAQNTTVTSSIAIAQRPEVYVGYASGTILAFDDAGNAIALPAGAFSGLQRPVALAYDDTDATLFVADAGAGKILAFDANGVQKPGFTPPALPGVNGVAWDSSLVMDEVIASSPSAAIIFSARTGGSEGDTAVTSPFNVTAGAGVAYVPPSNLQDNVLLVGDATAQSLDAYTTYGSPTLFGLQQVSITPPAGTPAAIAVDPLATVAWVSGTSSGAGYLWRLPLQATSPPAVSLADSATPAGVAYDSTIDRLFVAESTTNSVAAYKSDLSGTDPSIVLVAPASSGVTNPQGVAIAY
ncbi:MAG: hypothetical protein ACXVA3_13115 [Vulcanimicrobiaceae bacterium]